MKDFVPYQEALALRELGFDEPCICGYSTSTQQLETYSSFLVTKDSFTVDAPTYSQAFRFFREKYNLHAEPYTANMGAIEYCFLIRDLYSEKYVYDNFVGAGASYGGTFDTPEEAELACLKKLIEIVKNKAI